MKTNIALSTIARTDELDRKLGELQERQEKMLDVLDKLQSRIVEAEAYIEHLENRPPWWMFRAVRRWKKEARQ